MPDRLACTPVARPALAARRAPWRGWAGCLLALWLAAVAVAAAAGQAVPLAEDPVLEARMLDIAHELRCLVCQNETIAASHADLAVDLRQQIREQLAAGRSERQVKDYMVERYGEFVLYRPRFEPTTWLLWTGPFVLLALGFGVLWRLARKTAPQDDGASPLDTADRERARRLLEGGPQ